ncbi:von Willebrand factor D and EGF domain-containing protein-like [Ruditapes philippinarum]|uniref:von Willebrand factor D and EGF domain-containing protein-like n=1 Tax=Ruditapes philippinarum TaxID=129788 RepID=UPI00295A920C|nr:von Willebrand factor D and EGF domain-containing protein-like [Ruditapes philippinarum]
MLNKRTCSCSIDFFGPTCSNIKSEGPVIEDIEGGGFCDQSYGRDCSCSAVQLEALHEFFFCKRVMIQKTVSGESRVVGTELVPGWYRNMYNGECCFEDDRRKRSTDSETDVLHYKHEISISNDGQTYGPIATLYVFDSLCVEVVTDDGGNASFYLKENTCIIEGTCYEAQAVDFSNYCFRCMPDITQYNWTEGCIKDKDESQSSTFIVGIIIGIVVGVVAVAVAVYFKHMKKPDRTVRPFQEFSDAAAMSRPSSSRPLFDRTQLE